MATDPVQELFYVQVQEQKNKSASVKGIESELSQSNNTDKTISTQNGSNGLAKAENANTRGDTQWVFPADLTTAENNKFWTKIVPYEVRYKTEVLNSNSQNSSNVYIRGQKFTNAYSDKTIRSVKGQASSGSKITSEYVMVNQTIALPYPDSAPAWSFNPQWGDELDSGGFMGALGEALNELMKGNWNAAAEKMANETKNTLTRLIMPERYDKVNRRVQNKRVETMFTGVGNRSFDLSWDLKPKSQTELYVLQSIVDVLKSLSLPALQQGSLMGDDGSGVNEGYLTFPALFEISFMFGQDENTFMPRFGPCACTSLDISPYEQGGWQARSDGSPLGYGLKLSFTEVFPMVRDNLEETPNEIFVR